MPTSDKPMLIILIDFLSGLLLNYLLIKAFRVFMFSTVIVAHPILVPAPLSPLPIFMTMLNASVLVTNAIIIHKKFETLRHGLKPR